MDHEWRRAFLSRVVLDVEETLSSAFDHCCGAGGSELPLVEQSQRIGAHLVQSIEVFEYSALERHRTKGIDNATMNQLLGSRVALNRRSGVRGSHAEIHSLCLI